MKINNKKNIIFVFSIIVISGFLILMNARSFVNKSVSNKYHKKKSLKKLKVDLSNDLNNLPKQELPEENFSSVKSQRQSCFEDLSRKACSHDDILDFWSTYSISGHFFWGLEKGIFPLLEFGWPILKTINNIASEGKIDLNKALLTEKIDLSGPHREEIMQRITGSIKEAGNKSDKTILKLFSISFPALVSLGRGKIDISHILRGIRSYSMTVKKKYKDRLNSEFSILTNGKNNIYKAEISGLSSSDHDNESKKSYYERFKQSISFNAKKIIKGDNKYNLNSKGPGPLKKSILSLDKKSSYRASFILDLNKKTIPSLISKIDQSNIEFSKNQLINNRMSGIYSLIKALQINTGKVLTPLTTKKILYTYDKLGLTLPDLKKQVIEVLNYKKGFEELTKEQQMLVANLSSLLNIVFRESNLLSNVPIMPKDFVTHYKIFGTKHYAYNEGDKAINKIIEIVTGKGNQTNSLVVTCFLCLSNIKQKRKNFYNIHYFNVVHYDKSQKRFLIDDTEGYCYWISKDKLKMMMKLNVKNSVSRYISNSEKKIFENLFGKDDPKCIDRALNMIHKTLNERVGGLYGFLVADVNNILSENKDI